MSVFVPYHQVFDGAESFFDNQRKFRGLSNDIPRFNAIAVLQGICQNPSFASVVTSGSYDFKLNASSTSYYRLTSTGRFILKTLNNLGYRFAKVISNNSFQFNALPLLAYAHAYNSYLSYSALYNYSSLSQTLETIKRAASDNNTLTYDQIKVILTSILLTYEESFATSLWKEPYAALGTNQADNAYRRLESPDVAWHAPYDCAIYAADGGASVSSSDPEFTAAQIRMVMKFDDYFRRSNYSGSKDIEQIYSRFGVKIDDYRTRYPYFLNESTQIINIGDVTSTSDSGDVKLGDYAGKAIGSSNSRFHFESHDYGMLFTFGWFAPVAMYANGVDKEVLRLNPFDYYTPELDEGFASPVKNAQIDVDRTGMTNTFGFAPLYSEYLYPYDIISGEYTRLEGFDAWHFGRGDLASSDLACQNDKLIYMPCGGTQFERIFNITDTDAVDADTIYMTISSDVSATRPMRDFSGKAQLGEGDIDLPALGSQMN